MNKQALLDIAAVVLSVVEAKKVEGQVDQALSERRDLTQLEASAAELVRAWQEYRGLLEYSDLQAKSQIAANRLKRYELKRGKPS